MSDLKLEAGKFYKTRNGRKAFISAVGLPNPDYTRIGHCPIHGHTEGLPRTWHADGHYNEYADDLVEHPLDLVAPWRDECDELRRERDNWKAQALDATAECNALAAKAKELEQELSCEEALVLMWSSRAESLAAKLQAFEDQKIRDSNYAQGVVKERDALAAKVAQWEQAFEQERAEKKELGMERNELQHKVARIEAALGKLEEWEPIYVGRIRNALNPPATPGKKRVKGFVNVYGAIQHAEPGAYGLYSSRDDANSGASSDRIACIEIEVEEGEGL